MRNYLLLGVIILFSLTAFAQTTTKWKVSLEPQKVFIENKSQFDGRNKLSGSEILFGTDESPVMIYFTKNGLSYCFTKTEIKQKSEEEHLKEETRRRRKDEEHEATITTDVVNMEWENSNPSVQVIQLEKESFYFSYSNSKDEKNLNHVNGFRKILYKELYPNIDAEYTYHPTEGIKYSLILHPGADISQVKMKYSGTNRVFIDEAGTVHLATKFGDILDHAPITTYEFADNASIPSHFLKEGKTVLFELGDYDHNQTVVIDPWTITPSLPSANIVYYIKSDSAGNAYLYGGDNPIRLQKYDTAGSLVWTYNTPWTTSSIWFGASTTDRNGNSYITDGTGATCRKIDTSGAFVWSNSSASPPANSIEYWALALNCDQTQLMVAGSRHIPFSFSFNAAVFKIDMTNGSVSSFANVAHKPFTGTPAGISEVRSMCGANGNYYYLTLDTVGGVNNNLGTLFGQSTNYNFPYYMLYSSPSSSGQGQNNICANSQFIYSTDGGTVHKRDITTGAILATATIPSGAANNNSGVAVDSCGNVYVGAQNRVAKYDGNLTFINSFPTPEPVYDISVGVNGDVLACGHNYAVALAVRACSQYKPDCCTASASISSNKSVICSGDSAEICATSGMTSYLWNTGETTPCIEAKLAGNYYVSVSDGGSCSATSNHLGLSVYPLPPVSISLNGDTLTAYNAVTYQWFLNGNAINGATSNIYIAHQTGDYTVAVTDTNGCLATSTKVTIVTGINDLVKDEEIKIYPNPISLGNWQLIVGSKFLGSLIEIFDDNGRLVYEAEIRNQKSEIELNVAKGVYMMKVHSAEKNITIKLIRL